MSSALDMSLDDIVKNNKSNTTNDSKPRFRGRGGGGPTRRFNNRSANRSKPYASAPKAPESAWKHDMYSDQMPAVAAGVYGGGAGGRAEAIETGTKLYISNLDYGISNEDIKELFSEVGDLKRFSINYDRSGRSKGMAEVVFSRRLDAVAAVKRYNNVQLNGKPMKIEIVGTNIATPPVPQPPQVSNVGFGNPNGVPRRFKDHFSNRVKQPIYTFPDDAATSTGAPFWSAPKRFPQPSEFSASDPAHLHFIMDVPDWAKSPKKLATSMSTASTDDAAAINDLLPSWKSLQEKLPPAYRMDPIQFEEVHDAANISSGTTILAFICGGGDVGIIAADSRVSSGNPALGTFSYSDDCFDKINIIVNGRIYAAFSGTVRDCKAVIKRLQDSVTHWTQSLNIDMKDIEVHRVVLEAKNIIRTAERRSKVDLLILGWDQPNGMRVYSVNSAGEHRHDHILTFGSGASSIALQSWNIDLTEDQAYDWVRKVMAEAMYFDPNSGGKVCCATIFPHGKFKEQIDWHVAS